MKLKMRNKIVDGIDYSIYDKICGNWAGWDGLNKAYCGWMDFHTDRDDVTRAKPWFKLKVKYADPSAYLIHSDVSGRLYCTKPKVGDIVQFQAYYKHALLPRDIAADCLLAQSTRYQRKILPKGKSVYDTEVRLVWEWLDAYA